MENNTVLSLQQVQKDYQQGKQTLHVLRDVTLDVQAGEMIALVGPSGSGKSTLLQIAGLLDNPTAGKIYIDGKDCSTLNDGKRTAIRRDQLGFVYQFHHLLPEFNALENIMMPLLVAKVARKEAEARALEVLEKMGLKDRAVHRPSELSGGEQQRVAIGRAIVHNPLLLLADEPTGNLDPSTSDHVFDVLLKTVADLGLAVFIVTHNPQLAARMHKVVTLKDGVLVEESKQGAKSIASVG